MKQLAKTLTLITVLSLVLIIPTMVFANASNGTEFQSIYDRVMGWVTGMPAIIIAISVALLGVVRAFQSGGWIWAFAGIIVAAIIFLLPDITSGLGGATF